MLTPLFYPESIAVLGVSRTPGKVGHDIVANLLAGGYAGRIIPVNPAAPEVLGLPCLAEIRKTKEKIDLCIIALPSSMVLESVRDCLEARAGAIAVISSGFKETGAEGAELQRRIAELCQSHKVPLLGPNCLGLINTEHRMNASFASRMPSPGCISVISQSGAICTALLDLAAARHTGIAKMVSMGNKADLNEGDLLIALAADPQTKVIIAYLEDIACGAEFVKAATEASSKKPVIILKAGTTVAGQKAASSHTGVLAGEEIAYGAAFMRSGVIRADNFEALADYGALFAMQPLPKGKRVLIITNAGGPGTMAADAVEKAGMIVATLDRNTASALRQKLPSAASIGNPIDVLGDAEPDRYVAALEAAQEDEAVDAVVIILTPQAMTKPAETARAIARSNKGEKPVVVAFMGGADVMPGRDELVAAGLPDYPSPERAVAALQALVEYAAWRKRPPRMVARFPVNRRRVEPHHHPPLADQPAADRRGQGKEHPGGLRLPDPPGVSGHQCGRGHGNSRTHRLSGGHEDRFPGHYPQIRPRRGPAQRDQLRCGGGRLRPHDAPHCPAGAGSLDRRDLCGKDALPRP